MKALEVTELSVYFGGQPILHNVTCGVDEGEFLAVVGPNGAGKTTFLKVLLGLVKPSAGSVLIHGKSPAEIEPKWLGYVPQVKTLDRTFPALAIELVVSGLRGRWPARVKPDEREAAMKALEQVDAADLANRALNSLSGGELQRVYLACSTVRKPRLIVMDEPATGIDVVAQKTLYQILDDFRKDNKSTVVMVTHDWGVAHHHSTAVVIINREMIAFGLPKVVLTNDNLARAYGHAGHSMINGLE
jgi:zinc transport system ATP-binding protein